MANFTDFSLNNTPASGSFIVGYNATGTAEQRTTIKDLLSTGLAAYDIFVSPDGVTALSGAPTSVEGLVVKNGNNIVADWPAGGLGNSNSIEKLSASSVLGISNSAIHLNLGAGGFTNYNYGTSINGVNNIVNAGASNVQGASNYVQAAGVQVAGFNNNMGMHASSVEGIYNTIGRPITIAKTVSATNTIFLHEPVNTTASGITPGERVAIDGIQGITGAVSVSFNTKKIFTVATASDRFFTVVEPLTSMYLYVDNKPYDDYRFVVGIAAWSSSNNVNYTGAHAEGSFNYVLQKNSHVEGMNNTAASNVGHAEGTGNFVGNTSHVEGLETRAGMNVAYFDSYDAATKTFQLYTNYLSTFNTFNAIDMVPNSIIYYTENSVGSTSGRRNLVRFVVLSADAALGTVTALSAVGSTDIISTGSSVLSRSQQLLGLIGSVDHAQGVYTVAANTYTNAEGYASIAKGIISHAGGVRSTAQHDYSYAWSSGDGWTTLNQKNHATTRTGQYMVSAHGGVFLPGKVGIGTDSMDNALTVNGTISATSITADSISYNGAGFNTLPTYKTYQTNLAVKNNNWPAVSAAQLAEINYFNNQGTFAMPGALLIKGHSPDYSTSLQNLPGKGTYGLWLQNVDNMDPGTTFASDGRAQVTHAMSFRAGISNFTAGSDHNHVQWQGAPSNSTQAWQMTNGGNNGSVYGYQFPYTNRFMVHTLPQYQISTSIAAVSGFFDTQSANLGTDSDRLTGVKIIVDAAAGAGNYGLITVGEVVGITLNPGLVGLAAVIYETQCTLVSSNNTGTLSTFQFDFFIGNGTNWSPAFKGIQAINLKSRAQGGNPGVNQITSQIGTPNTHYIGLTGSYRGMNKHCLARFTTGDILTGFKPGSPLTLWIPKSMPSSSPIGSGFITSDKISTFALGTFPTGVRSGYFDAYVINISGGDMEFALCNLMDSYSFENRTWPISAAGNAGWLLYGGTQDTVHRPTFGTTGFYFEREAWSFTGPNYNYLSGGMVKCVGLGNSEVYGDYSYGLGYRGAVLGKKSGTFAGDYNTVFGNNSVALGGSNLISTSGNQVVIGTFNDPNTNSLFVVGSGASDTTRKNVFEVTGDGDTKQSRFNIKSSACIAGAGSTQATATPITTDVVTVTGGGNLSGIILPTTNGGHYIQVFNYSGTSSTLNIYPNVGGIIKSQGIPTNTPFTIPEGGYALITSLSANTWFLI